MYDLPGPQKIYKIMTFMAVIMALGLLFYILLGFRYLPGYMHACMHACSSMPKHTLVYHTDRLSLYS